MARRVTLLAPLLLVGCAASWPTAHPLDARPLEAEIWLAIGQSNMEVLADTVPQGADHVEVQQFGHDPQFDITVWTSLTRAGKFSAVAGEFAATLSRLRRRPVRIIAAAVGGTDLSCWERGGDCYENQLGRLRAASVPIVGVIWWQGETEAIIQDSAVIATYGTRLGRFFQLLRSDFHAPRMPVVMVGLQRYCEERPERAPAARCDEPADWQTVRAAQQAVAANVPRVELVDVSGFTSGDLHPIAQYPLIGRMLAERAARFQ
jgi:carbohydrate esterase-like sialic acid-specific acetylesterase